MKRTALKLASILLGAILLFAPIFGVAAEVDLSRPGSEHNRVQSRGEILSYLIGESLCDEEIEYLDSLPEDDAFSIVYDVGIPSSVFSVIYDDENKELSVYAKPYSYTTVDSRPVEWIPTLAVAKDSSSSLTLLDNGIYFAKLTGVDGSVDKNVEVKYTLDLTLTPEMANSLINRAYNDAPRIKEAHALACREHESAVALYNDYLERLDEYNEKLSDYEKYVAEYTEYSEALLEYNAYLQDLAEYEEASAAYAAYLVALSEYEENCSLYAEYLNRYKIYSAEYDKYKAYLSAAAPYRSQLAAVDLADRRMTHLNRSARSAINGGTVDTVLAQKDTLESPIVNAPGLVIDMAGDATERVRVLMDDYFALETEEAKYAYYAAYYEDFRDNFVNLFISLDYLYRVGPIRAYIYERERDEKYRILLAELYYVATALSDTPVMSVPKEMVEGTNGADGYKQFTYTSSYLTADGYSPVEILSQKPIEDTNKAQPYEAAFPTAVAEPVAPDPVSEPVKPATVQPPHKVVEVQNPGEAPIPVDDPGEAPELVPDPGPAPVLSPEQIGVIEAYEAGNLSFSNELFTNDVIFTVERNIRKNFVDPTFATVTFMDMDSAELYSVTVERGSVVLYEGLLPKKTEDVRTSYEFAGWVDSEGNAVSLDAVVSDLILYPAFREILKIYTVTVNVDGKVMTYDLHYGDIPPLPSSPEKADDGLWKYPFIGWDKDASEVTEDTTYTAIFGKEYLIPMSGGGAHLGFTDGVPTADYSSGFDSEFDITELLLRAYGKTGATLITRYGEIRLPYLTVKELSDHGVTKLKLTATEGRGSYSYSISALNKDGASQPVTKEASVSFPSALEPNDRLRLYTVSDGVRNYSRFTSENGILSFSISFGELYVCEYEYSVIAASSDLVSLKIDGNAFSAGSSVGVEVVLGKGLRLTRLYYRTSSGEECELDSTRFTMPSEDIVLYAEVDYVYYKISFVSDGRTVRTILCKEGDIPSAPEQPKKLGEKGYGYTFVGWSPEVSEAEEDVVYTAVFERFEITAQEDKAATEEQLKTSYIIVGAAIALLVIAGVCLISRRGY